MATPVVPLILGAGAIAAIIAFTGKKDAKAALPPKTTLQGELAHMSVPQRVLFERLMNRETDPAQVGAGAAQFNFNGFPIASKALGDRAKRMAAGKKEETLNDEVKRMAPEQRQQFQRLATQETDPAKVGAGGAMFNALGFPKAGRFLTSKAQSMAIAAPKKKPPRLTTQPVGPGVPVLSPADAEFARMPPQLREHYKRLLLSSTNPAELGSAAATANAQGFPAVSKLLSTKAGKLAQARSPVPIAQPFMPAALKRELAEALQRLNAQPDGSVRPPISKADIQFATMVEGKLNRKGFPDTGRKLRALIQKASRLVASPPPERKVDIPGIPPSLRDQINRALELERDPDRLRALLAALKTLPKSSERDLMIAALEALIASIEAKEATDDAANEAEEVIKSPGLPQPPKKERRRKKRPPERPVIPPDVPPPTVPVRPKPQPTPLPSSPQARLAQQLAAHLNQLQARLGMPRAKGDQDMALTKRFQAAVNEKQDGKPGPNTFLAMARLGVSKMPLVMYWPRRSTLNNVEEYRQALLSMADVAEAAGQNQRAAELRQSAQREKGQGGVVGVRGTLKQSKGGIARKSEVQRMTPAQVNAVHDAFASNSASRMKRVAALMQKAGFPNTARHLLAEAAKTKVAGWY